MSNALMFSHFDRSIQEAFENIRQKDLQNDFFPHFSFHQLYNKNHKSLDHAGFSQ